MTRTALLASSVVVSMFAANNALATDWTGLYIGVHAGGALGDVDWTNVSNATGGQIDFDPGETINQEPDGVLGGAQLGYNLQMTNWLFGIEVSGSGLDFDETTLNTNPGDTNEFVTSEIEWLAIAAARLGWTWSDSLLYVKGGYATGDVNTSHTDPGNTAYATEETHGGWMAGAGLEHQIGDRVSVGIEYNYIDLGEQDHSGLTAPGADLMVNTIDVQMHTVTARLNWHLWAY